MSSVVALNFHSFVRSSAVGTSLTGECISLESDSELLLKTSGKLSLVRDLLLLLAKFLGGKLWHNTFFLLLIDE